ncbi:MAG: DUF998 domain-containing protein [Desulfurococcus sp.]|nr:DUF998 domain-containing protein [Desulfurococcus sp.]
MRYCYLPFLSIAIPLVFIVVASVLSGWFNPLSNALSDLGHSEKSSVAAVFNTGVVLGGLLAYTVALTSRSTRRSYNAILVFTSVSLVFVGVFNEAYGWLHLAASILFFMGTAFFLAWMVVVEEGPAVKALSLVALLVGLAAWILHLAYKIPRGAAVPELVSIACFTIPYLYTYAFKNPGCR